MTKSKRDNYEGEERYFQDKTVKKQQLFITSMAKVHEPHESDTTCIVLVYYEQLLT